VRGGHASSGTIARLTPDERRALFEQLQRYQSFSEVIEMMGRAAIQACEPALQ